MGSIWPSPHLLTLDRNNLRAACTSGTLAPMKTYLSTATLPLLWKEVSGRLMGSIWPSPHLLTLEDRRRARCRPALHRSGSGMPSAKQGCLSTPPPPLVLVLPLHIQTGRPIVSIWPSPYLLSLEDRRRARCRSGS